MRKVMMYLLLAFFSTIILLAVIHYTPLRASEKRIRANMLKLTPIGTGMEDVIKVIESNKKWRIRYTFDKGYSILGGGQPSVLSDNECDDNTCNDHTLVGVKSMDVHIADTAGT